MISRALRAISAIALLSPAFAQNPSSSGTPYANLTAREIFYSPGPAAAAAALPAAKNAPPAARKRPAQTAARKTVETDHDATVAADSNSHPSSPVPSSVRAAVIQAADHRGKALGLRYTILKVSNGAAEPVGIHSVFHSGDRIKISVQVNDPAYLYVISKGSSGTWAPLFPSKDVEDGSNRVEPGRTYDIPPGPGRVIAFREPSGSERLFVVVSREPEPSLEKLIYAVNGGGAQQAPAAETPATPKSADTGVKVLMASANIGEDTVGGLRVYSRDLIVEDAGQEANSGPVGASPDKSFYAVNPSGSSDSRVVADITLNHQ